MESFWHSERICVTYFFINCILYSSLPELPDVDDINFDDLKNPITKQFVFLYLNNLLHALAFLIKQFTQKLEEDF